MACAARLKPDATTTLVWAPMTTCYAFDKFGADCSGGSSVCSVDGTGGLSDGSCVDDSCTYSCWDGVQGVDTWCPVPSGTCGTSPPFIGLCEI